MIVTLKADGEEMPTLITQAGPEHTGLVMNSWLESYKVCDDAKHMKRDTFFRQHHRVATVLLERSVCLVATPEKEPSVFIGWACAEPDIGLLHYSFVKRSWRHAGLFGHFINAFADIGRWPPDSEIVLTHHTYFIDNICRRSPKWARRMVYNPYRRAA